MEKLFIPARYIKDPIPAVKKALPFLGESVGVLASSQHLDRVENIKKFLEENGKNVVLGGQVLGCNAENAVKIEDAVDCFLFIGSGRFHPLWVALKTEKPVVAASPYSDSASPIDEAEKKKYLGRKRGRLLRAASAEVFGVVVSTKPGQMRLSEAKEIRDRLETLGKKAYLFAGDQTSPDNLLPFKVDCWINTACPRLADDHFEKPVVNLSELPELLELIGT